jgi:putative membrane protein
MTPPPSSPGQAGAANPPGTKMQNAQTGEDSAPARLSDSDYVHDAAILDMFEIQSSELDLQKTKNPQIRNFAERMIKDHGQSSQELTKLVQSANLDLAPPMELDREHAILLRDLRQSTGEHFERSYLKL